MIAASAGWNFSLRGTSQTHSQTGVSRLFRPLEFRQNHSRRNGGHGSHTITIHICSCHSVPHFEMCAFLHGSTFSRSLRYCLGLLAVDPKLGEKKWRLQKPGSVHTSFVHDEAV